MFKTLICDKDSYITNKIINGDRKTNANFGDAGSLNLFKLYGMTNSGSTPNIELSRLLIHFDLSDLRNLYDEGKLNLNSSKFNCMLKMKDVYGGQTTPSAFYIELNPLSQSFDEGVGKDVVYCSDYDVCNWLTSSYASGTWYVEGCGLSGSSNCDFITGSNNITWTKRQYFNVGTEDLSLDITSIISATLTNQLPDAGFRLSLTNAAENDTHSYFVKRFAGRSAYNAALRPKVEIKFDDSIQDDSLNLYADNDSTLFLYNYGIDGLENLISSSVSITGSNSLLLKLKTEISGGYYELTYTGSQHSIGTNPVVGVYSASFNVATTNSTIRNKLLASSSIQFSPIWCSIDGTYAYVTGSMIEMRQRNRTSINASKKKYIVSVVNIPSQIRSEEEVIARVNVFDQTEPNIVLKRTLEQIPNVVIRRGHFQIRDSVSNDILIAFDTTYDSTRLSSDGEGMFFKFNTADLPKDRTYVIDIMLKNNDQTLTFVNASPEFKVSDLQ